MSSSEEHIIVLIDSPIVAEKVLCDPSEDGEALSDEFDTNCGSWHPLTIGEAIALRDAIDAALKSPARVLDGGAQ